MANFGLIIKSDKVIRNFIKSMSFKWVVRSIIVSGATNSDYKHSQPSLNIYSDSIWNTLINGKLA